MLISQAFPMPSLPPITSQARFQESKLWTSLPQSIQEQLRTIIDVLLKYQNERFKESKSYTAPVLPKLHGTFPKPWERSGNSASRLKSAKNKTLSNV